jgi:hypothetical protein
MINFQIEISQFNFSMVWIVQGIVVSECSKLAHNENQKNSEFCLNILKSAFNLLYFSVSFCFKLIFFDESSLDEKTLKIE